MEQFCECVQNFTQLCSLPSLFHVLFVDMYKFLVDRRFLELKSMPDLPLSLSWEGVLYLVGVYVD